MLMRSSELILIIILNYICRILLILTNSYLFQALLSYGLLLGIGAGVVREASTLVLGHYFKRRREFVEMVAEAGTGVGIALFSVLYKEAVG